MAAVPRLRAFLCTDHPDRRKFLSHTLAAATATMPSINLTAAAGTEPAVKSVTNPTKRKFVEEATRWAQSRRSSVNLDANFARLEFFKGPRNIMTHTMASK